MSIQETSKSPFYTHYYQRNTRRRLEHLASLGLKIQNKSVFEAGAGAGDLTDFFIDRGCQVVTSEGRKENLEILKGRYPNLEILDIDFESPPKSFNRRFEIVFCYGLLYHLENPVTALNFFSSICSETLILQTTVNYDKEKTITFEKERTDNHLHSISGVGCRPSRKWVFEELSKLFKHCLLYTSDAADE